MKNGCIEQFEQYSQFSSLKEFNTHMEMWLAVHKDDFSKGERVGLKRLVRFAAKIPGVCNAKIGTVLKAIHDEHNGNGISRSTFKRMIQKAIGVGMLTVHETERKNGSQSSNLYVFQPFPKNELPKENQLNHPNKTSNPLKTNSKKIKERKETDSANHTENKTNKPLDYTYTSDRVPYSFSQVVRYFYTEAKQIEEFWRMTQIAAYRNNFENRKDLVNIAVHSFKQLISKLKVSTIQKPIAYYYGILNKKLEELYFEDLYEMEFCMALVKNQLFLSFNFN
ncbi:hypothetical protein [Robertmurraya korlensis]|uniref:hypothetical protein n=1 Tax=Robertmurraya korlensis TaxID=519977 RepID=UPI0008257009|nr:hypothetical protein [Robertmurraya korlensis]